MTPIYSSRSLNRRLVYMLFGVGLLGFYLISSYVIWHRSIHGLFEDRLEIPLNAVPEGQRFQISDLAVNSKGNIVVCDRESSRIIWFGTDGSFVKEIGSHGNAEAFTYLPSALAFDSRDSLYVACHEEVLIFDPRLNFARKFNIDFSQESEIGVYQIMQDNNSSRFGFFTKSMAVDCSGNIYLVGYHPLGIVHKFMSEGQWVMSFADAFNHPKYRIRRYYSGGKIELGKDRLYLTHQVPYNVTTFELDGTPIKRFLRPEIDFNPRFEVDGTRNTYKPSSRGMAIFTVDSLLINQFFVLNEGMHIDVYDFKSEFAYLDIPLNAYLLASDSFGNIYYVESNSSGASIFRGRLVDEYKNYDKSKM